MAQRTLNRVREILLWRSSELWIELEHKNSIYELNTSLRRLIIQELQDERQRLGQTPLYTLNRYGLELTVLIRLTQATCKETPPSPTNLFSPALMLILPLLYSNLKFLKT